MHDQELIKILLTVFLSAVIGTEREIRSKGAGLRTHILVGVGSCLIVLTSLYLFDIYNNVTRIDPTRMIAGIITGIGFLCAGTIIRSGESVIGLTTAATVWIVSCVGISVGCGHYFAAIMTTLIVFIVLVGMRTVDKHLHQNKKKGFAE
ncbi:MAG TPA: MgtC/SapB family protein [Candidatus Omnitrophota bacterium]|nr:MgtC/SapB family protein [Candidatus Omnitrophota bacterium]HPN88177.1 MgtC/SapB family protein [Candidatus Omnitrophota bacterium]